jgi:hypothetical protein
MPGINIISTTTNTDPVIMHFHSEASPYSKIQSVVLDKFDDIDVKTRNIDDHEDSFVMYDVSVVPTVIFIKKQDEKARWTTVVSYEDIRNTIDAYL